MHAANLIVIHNPGKKLALAQKSQRQEWSAMESTG